MFKGLFRASVNRTLIDKIHGKIVAGARQPALYAAYGVGDTLEGRFELVTLHAMLVLRQLRHGPPPGADMAQDLADAMFRHFDADLREMGVGDVTVPKRIKKLASAFVGRCAAYEKALAEGEAAALEAALQRNIFMPGEGDAARLTRYVGASAGRLERLTPDDIASDDAIFMEASEIA